MVFFFFPTAACFLKHLPMKTYIRITRNTFKRCQLPGSFLVVPCQALEKASRYLSLYTNTYTIILYAHTYTILHAVLRTTYNSPNS